ncbi:dynein axonemal assembly factor 8 [Chaetodon auriga]|uniref:dynein axonemal assembly factor 8 n=1 Tax=Chaetodon auriga TaxID=39042 RepID=UPI0040330605
MDMNYSSYSILEKVKPHLPTIDFDSSPSENEEIITIYQRPAGLSLEVPEDFDCLSMDDDDPEELLKPVPQTYWSEETCSQSVKLDDDEIVEVTAAAQWSTQRSDVKAGTCGIGIVEMKEAKLDASEKPNVDSTKADEGFPVLSFARLDQWDLDVVLQNLKEDGLSLQQHVSAEPAKIHEDGDKDRSQTDIMKRLVALCKSQSSKSVSEPVKSPNHIRHNNVWNKSSVRMEAELQCSLQECPTVYIDLRCPDPSIKAPGGSLDLSPESKSPARPNTHQETPPAKKPNLTAHTGSRMRDRSFVSDQQGQQVQQQQQQILKKLEKHRPTKSVNQKQPAAERTDVLYDFEASHLQSISTLPADIESQGCMLLIVDLSSPGMVGPNPRHDEDEAGAKVPFWVAGLQQLWTEDGLALHVLAVARHCYAPRVNRGKKDIHMPFCNHVRRFLSETSLTLIAERNNSLDQQAFASCIHLPSSYLNCFISATPSKKVIDRTFGPSPGFYWQTVETQERVCKARETALELHTEVSVALGCKAFFLHPLITHYTLQLVLEAGLDVCGLRLLYPPQRFLSESAGAAPVVQRTDETCQPVLALAVRGPHAHSVLKDLTCSLDPLLPRRTDSTPLGPLQCGSQEAPLLHSPRLATEVHRELCLWFSGRLQGESAHNYNRVLPLDDRVRGSLFSLSKSPSFLCATTKGTQQRSQNSDLLLVVSPVIPPCCYGQILAVCEHRGFSLQGLQRLQLQSNGAAVLGLPDQQALVFCSPYIVTLDQQEVELPSHCLVLLLRKENAMRHSVSLPAALMREFEAKKLLGCIHSRLDGVQTVEPSFCFHTVSYSSNLFHIFGKRMWAVPDPSSVILSHHKCSSNPNMEQVVILTLCGKDMSQGLSLLHRALTGGPEGFELLGLKCLPALTRFQAQELSPYEVGEQLCHNSLYSLMSSPVLVCALRRVEAFVSLRNLLPHDYPGNLSVLMSPTPAVAFRQASLFFFEHEMIPDYRITPVLKFQPQNCSTKDPQTLLTVCLFKPRIWNHTLAQMIRTLRLSGLTLVGLRVVTLDRSDASSLLPAESDPSDVEAHVDYMCSGASLALCLEGENAVKRLLDVLGQEDSSLWTTCHGMAHLNHGIYGSGSNQKAIQDVKRLFPEGLCCAETSTMRQEQIFNMCSDPLASVEREHSCTLASVAQEGLSPLMASGPNGGSLIHSALWQTTCLLIPLNTPPLSQMPSQLDILEQLLGSGCHLVAGRMSKLDDEQKKHIAQTLKVFSGGNERMAHLSTAPCLIMALQGEAVATCFNSILESIYKERPDLEKVGEAIIYPESKKEAKQLICYLFDALSPESCHTIVP